MCAILLVVVAHAFGTVGHVQQSMRRMAKCTLKEFDEVNKVSSRPCTFFASIAAAPLSFVLINLATASRGSG